LTIPLELTQLNLSDGVVEGYCGQGLNELARQYIGSIAHADEESRLRIFPQRARQRALRNQAQSSSGHCFGRIHPR
jgi:hypothetical protein